MRRRGMRAVAAGGAALLCAASFLPGGASADEEKPAPEKPAAGAPAAVQPAEGKPGDGKAAMIRQVVEKSLPALYIAKAVLNVNLGQQGNRDVPVEFPVVVLDAAAGVLVCGNPEELVRVPGATSKDFKVLLPDGKELSAQVEANDSENGLMFLKLDGKEKIPSALSLDKTEKCELGSELVGVRRLSSSHPEAVAQLHRIASVLKKPRPAWLLGDGELLGTPVFSLEGSFVGIMARIRENGEGGRQNVLAVVLPADQLINAFKNMKPKEEEK